MSEHQDLVQVALAQIKGGIDLINERLLHSNQINDERHAGVSKRLDNHEGRIGGLERDKTLRDGERKGFVASGRALWAIVSVTVGAGGAFGLMKLFGG